MGWSEIYKSGEEPTLQQIGEYIDSPLWKELCDFVQSSYNSQPKIEYSCCTMCPGWNVKYKKGSKAICTLYPNEKYFTCMVTVSNKNQLDVECMLPSCDKYVQELYKKTTPFNGSRWLMVDVTSEEILRDVERIITSKMK